MVFYIFAQISIEHSVNKGDPDQTLRSVASDLGLHCLPLSQKNGRYAYMASVLQSMFRDHPFNFIQHF